MGTDVARGTGPEPTKYDRMRHESMKLCPNGLYGIPKIFLHTDKGFYCERCVFDSGEHTCDKSET